LEASLSEGEAERLAAYGALAGLVRPGGLIERRDSSEGIRVSTMQRSAMNPPSTSISSR